MKKLFIESSEFTARIVKFLDTQEYAFFQNQLMAEPNQGDVIPGCGGLRKIRLADPTRRKGKRGGARIIYLHIPEVNWIFLLDIYGKNEKEDLAPSEKKALKRLVAELKEQALAAKK
jgi:hypothetical protein